MPSGHKIDWSKYDHLIRTYLPNLTIQSFAKQHMPDISPRAIGVRARKLGIKPSNYKHGVDQKMKIANAITKITPEKISFLKDNRDSMSIAELSKSLNVDMLTVNRWLKSNGIHLTNKGRERARLASSVKQKGKIPWNKGKPLANETRIKIAQARQKQSGRISKIQLTLYRILDELGITYHKENDSKCLVGPWLFDCRVIHNNNDFFIEVQGDYWHSLPKTISKDNAKATYMSQYYPNIPVRYLWEHEFMSKNKIKETIKRWLGISNITQIDFDFNDVSIQNVDKEEARKFVAAFHYLEKMSGRLCVGAFLKDKLIAVGVWGAPTRIETATRLGVTHLECMELRRFVIHDSYHKKNFASWLLARFEKTIPKNIKVLVSFSDKAVDHIGTIYKASGWTDDGDTSGSYFYVDEDGYVMLKKTLFNRACGLKMTESDFASTYNYTKVKSPTKRRFIKWLDKNK